VRDAPCLSERGSEVGGELERVERRDEIEAAVVPRQALHRADP
jgi:hypothetical protein